MTSEQKTISLTKMATSTNQSTGLLQLVHHFSAAFAKSSTVVKTIAILVIMGYSFSFISSTIPYITVTPGYVMPPNFHIYSLASFCFVELHIWEVLTDIAVIILFGKLLEPLWGALETLLFFVIVNFSVGIITAFLYYTFYLVTLREEYLFDVHVYGLVGYLAGFSVAVKQVMPDLCVVTLPFGKVKYTNLPLILLILTILLRVVGLLPGPYPYMFSSGILVSWVYLRFYQKHGNGDRGDMAENFSLASFLPSHLQPVVAVIANSIFSGLVKLKLCKKPQRRYNVSSTTTITVTLPGTEPHDAERRKQLALKALNERLSKPDSTLSWPTLDGDDDEDENVTSSTSASPNLTSLQPITSSSLTSIPNTKDISQQNSSSLTQKV